MEFLSMLKSARVMGCFVYSIIKKRPADLSIVKRLGGVSWRRGTAFIWNNQTFSKKRINLAEEIVILPQSVTSSFLIIIRSIFSVHR